MSNFKEFGQYIVDHAEELEQLFQTDRQSGALAVIPNMHKFLFDQYFNYQYKQQVEKRLDALSKMSVTEALRTVLDSKGVRHKGTFSDSSRRGGGVAVKFVGVKYDEKLVKEVQYIMESAGFKFHYARYNDSSYNGIYNGTRFCFSKPNQ